MVEKIKAYMKSLEKEAIPQLSINCVIFGFHEKELKVIVNKISIDGISITVVPGGYVKQTEDLTVAVERIVRESTGLEKILFKQFAVFGDASRSFGSEIIYKKWSTNEDKKIFDWISKRFISICYLALVDFNKIELKKDIVAFDVAGRGVTGVALTRHGEVWTWGKVLGEPAAPGDSEGVRRETPWQLPNVDPNVPSVR